MPDVAPPGDKSVSIREIKMNMHSEVHANSMAAAVNSVEGSAAPTKHYLARLAGWVREKATAHPAGFWFLFWGELAERCSYYGMRAILMLYLIERAGFEKATASMAMSYFIAACYLLPLAGGYIADRFLGKYWTIVVFSVPYILGHVLLGIENVVFLVSALALLAMGSGVIKPNLSPLMGLTYDQKRPAQEGLRSAGFAMFYGAINIGGFISSFVMPFLRTEYGYATAFLFPAALMIVAFVIFAVGKPFYAVEPPAENHTPEERRERWTAMGRLAGIFGAIVAFWMIFDQSASTWVLLAHDHMDLKVFGYTLEPDQMQALNPLLVVILLPVTQGIWRRWKIKPTDKMLLGFVLTGICMVVMSIAGFLTAGGAKVSVLWQAAGYIVITVAELCVSVVGLEFAYTQAPKKMKSQVTAAFLLTVFVANLANAQITPLYEHLGPGWYFALMAALMVPVIFVFKVVAAKFNATEKDPEKQVESHGSSDVQTVTA